MLDSVRNAGIISCFLFLLQWVYPGFVQGLFNGSFEDADYFFKNKETNKETNNKTLLMDPTTN